MLRYEAATLVGSWQATGIRQGDTFASVISGTEITATFDADGTLSGSAGCNSYRATYTADRGRVEVAQPAGTEKACASPDGIMEQESAYLAALPIAVRYVIAGRSLELLTAAGSLVVSYTRASEP